MLRQHWSVTVGLAVTLALAAGITAPEPVPAGDCTWEKALLAEFDVADRASIRDVIPHMATAPELERGGVLVNGEEQLPAHGTYHLTLLRCLQSGMIPLIGGIDRATTPPVLSGILVVTTPSGDAWWYADVDLRDLSIPVHSGAP